MAGHRGLSESSGVDDWPTYPFPKGLIAGLIKGNQWVFRSPDHKARKISGGTSSGGVGRLALRWVFEMVGKGGS